MADAGPSGRGRGACAMRRPGRDSRARRAGAWALVATVALATVGVAALAQDGKPEAAPGGAARDRPARGREKDKAPKAKKGGLRVPGAPPKGALGKGAADPMAPAVGPGGRPADAPTWPFHYKFKLSGEGGAILDAQYYPSRLGADAPVVLFVHEKGGVAKEFEAPIDELKGKGLAESLQLQGYASLVVDFRGVGVGPRGEPTQKDWRGRTHDLQAAYQFLVDRHNRTELNLSKLAVVALGEGANLAALWAVTPGAATTGEARISDLAALVLVSPVAALGAVRFESTLAPLAPRVPLLLLAGERDAASKEPVKAARALVERQRLSKVTTYPTALHGAKLLRFTPQAPGAIQKFLDATLKPRKDEWEPRYNLTPVAYSDSTVVLPKDKAEPDKKDKDKDAPAKKADQPDPRGDRAPARKAEKR